MQEKKWSRVSLQALEKAGEVRQYIEENLLCLTGLAVPVLSRQFAISESLLRNAFVARHSVPLHTFIIRKRMEYASSLLTTKLCSIKEVSLELGYNDLSNFSRDFKTSYGVSPQVYRRLVQNLS